MYLSMQDRQALDAMIGSAVSCPVFVFDEAGAVLSMTHPPLLQNALELLRKTQCLKEVPSCTCLRRRFSDDKDCCAIALRAHAEKEVAFALTVLKLLHDNASLSTSAQLDNTRTMLTNQLASISGDLSITAFVQELKYSADIPRCAILCRLEKDTASSIGSGQLDLYFSQAMRSSPFFSSQDIYGALNPHQFLIFKAVDSRVGESSDAAVSAYVSDLSAFFRKHYRAGVNFGVGSNYSDIFKLHNSYNEAAFLISNFEFLNQKKDDALYIRQFVFEYLFSLLPSRNTDLIFREFNDSLERRPKYSRTISALSKNEYNFGNTAAELALHRNTVLQRFSSIKSALCVDPLYHGRDRLMMRGYSLYLNRTLTWHAGITIQPGSVLHRGMEKFAQLVYEKSNGTMQISIHTIALSGDNNGLFKSLCAGAIDCIMCSTLVLGNITNGLSDLLELPFLFDSTEQAYDLLNTIFCKELSPYFESAGAVCSCIWTMGWRYITSKTPIRVPSDIKGKRMRIMFSNTLDAYYRLLDAIPVQTYYDDISSGLASNSLDCQENPYTNILQMEFYKHQKYISEFNYHYSTEALVFSKKSWDILTPGQRKIIMSAAEEATSWEQREQIRMNIQSREELISKHGLELVSLTPEEQLLWRKAAEPLYAKIRHNDIFQKILQAKEEYHEAR